MTRRSIHNSPAEGFGKRALKKKHLFGPDLLDAIDERPEFHDPYSELNLFLSQKVKNEMRHCSNSKKWSPQLQDELLCKITPEFQERFPKYRLGVSAIKKTWEKVQYFSGQVQEKKEALTQDGKLNIPFFIKENLKSTSKLQNTCHVHPCHYAHQLAAKMSECIAVVDGIRPKLEQLTRTIWSLQRHLIPSLPPEHFKSPYDENEKVDKLVVRSLLEITAKHPEISQAELVFHLQKRLIQLRHVTTTYSETQMRKMLSALYADQCHYPNQRMERTLERIPYPTAKCLKGQLASLVLDNPHMGPEQITEEAFAYFERANHALANLEEEEIERKIQNWAIQNDMLMRWIRLNQNSALYKEIVSAWKEKKDLPSAIKLAQQNFLDKYPKTIGFAKELETLSWIYLKHYWYTAHFPEKVSTFDRFLKWQKERQKEQNLSPQELLEKMEKLSKKILPLMPFNRTRASTILFTEQQQNTH